MTRAAPGAGAPARTPLAEPERLAVAFARVLRRSGVAVPSGAAVGYARALAAVGLGDEGRVYWAGRATLVHSPEDVAAYDEAFRAFWREHCLHAARATVVEVPEVVELAHDREEIGAIGGAEEERRRMVELRYSPAEVLRTKDFAACTPAELDEAQRLMATIRWQGQRRTTRRRRPARRGGTWPDLRRTVRSALRTEGEPLRRRWLEEGGRTRRVVFLCDVSGSMAPYARAVVRFLHVAAVAWRQVEVFTIGTRLTRVTRALRAHDPDVALDAVARAVPDWSGGTRLGEALRTFNEHWGVRGLARGAVVVIVSDGWDRGDPALLSEEMARLSRVAHEIVWVNPLKASAGYQPLVRGMAAALPYVDHFMEGHSLASLESLAEVVAHSPSRAARPPSGRGVRRRDRQVTL